MPQLLWLIFNGIVMPKKHYKLCKFEKANKNQMAIILLGSRLAHQKKSVLIKNLSEINS